MLLLSRYVGFYIVITIIILHTIRGASVHEKNNILVHRGLEDRMGYRHFYSFEITELLHSFIFRKLRKLENASWLL